MDCINDQVKVVEFFTQCYKRNGSEITIPLLALNMRAMEWAQYLGEQGNLVDVCIPMLVVKLHITFF